MKALMSISVPPGRAIITKLNTVRQITMPRDPVYFSRPIISSMIITITIYESETVTAGILGR